MEHTFFIDISLLLGIAIGIAFLVQYLKQPLIISHIITGIICGPLFLNLVSSKNDFFQTFAQFGVILLLFLVGLSLNLEHLKKIGKVAFFTGIGQVVFTAIFGYFLLLMLGFASVSAIFLATSVTFSSTIVIMKLLGDKREIMTVYGRYTVGLMLVQDLIAIGIMVILPSFGKDSDLLMSLTLLLFKSISLVAAVYLLSKIIFPRFLKRVASSGEFLLLFTLGWCFAVAGFGDWAGISLEVGAIIAGLSLGSSPYQMEISSRLKPIKDFFLVIFFIILGSEMGVDNFQSALFPGAVLSLFILIGNPLILYSLFRLMKFTRRNSFMAGITAAQVSEFGFVLLFVGQQMGYVDSLSISIFTIVALVTIFISSYLITYNRQVFDMVKPYLDLFGRDKYHNLQDVAEKFDVLVIGYHRLGWKICETLKKMNVKFAVIDFNPEVVAKLKEKEIMHFFGDCTDVEFLNDLPFEQTKMVISTLPHAEDQVTMIKHIRKLARQPIIIANLSFAEFMHKVYAAGADYIMVPHMVGGQWITEILENKAWNRRTFKALFASQQKELEERLKTGHH